MKKIAALLALIMVAPLSARLASSEEISGSNARIEAVQNRIYHRYHEIGIGAGLIPDEDFFVPIPLTASYTYHFNDLYGLDFRGSYVYNQERQLKEDLEQNFGVTPSEFKKIQYMGHIHGVYTPMYGKDSFLNKYILNHETYLMLGVGLVNYKSEFSFGPSDTTSAFSTSIILGKKFFLNEKFCLNFELRDMINISENETVNNFWFGISLGYRFDLAPRRSRNADALESLGRYLEDNE